MTEQDNDTTEMVAIDVADLNLAEYGDRQDVAALGRRIKQLLPGGSAMTSEEAMALAQYAISTNANPFRGEIYGGKIKGKFVLMEGYKLLVRCAKDRMPYTESFRKMEEDELPAGAIGFECSILRQDSAAQLAEFVAAGAKFGEAYGLLASKAIGVLHKNEMNHDPPKGWTWEQVAEKRALKNALKRSHGFPSPRELAAASWMVDGQETTPQDWAEAPPDESPEVQARFAVMHAETRTHRARMGQMTDAERIRMFGASRVLLHGDSEDPLSDGIEERQAALIEQNEKPETRQGKENQSWPKATIDAVREVAPLTPWNVARVVGVLNLSNQLMPDDEADVVAKWYQDYLKFRSDDPDQAKAVELADSKLADSYWEQDRQADQEAEQAPGEVLVFDANGDVVAG